jgi:UDP-N-acetylglucosamine 4-epimerase
MKILITGGAGFIGSNLVGFLLNRSDITLVRVLDNLATGHLSNLAEFMNNDRFEFINGDIRNSDDCLKACKDIDAISHQAALGSVPRSIAEPINSHNVNVNGFLNMLEAARVNNIKRFIYASSSSVYGDLAESPKVETRVGRVLSPYAATKMVNELYAEAYSKNYDMQIVGFRYFNVFGPKQDPNGPYAAVIPLFIKCALNNEGPVINGDGTITRDFTHISNVIQINTNALFLGMANACHEVVNVACGQTTDLNQLWQWIKDYTGAESVAIHGPNRKGDILFSLADISKAKSLLSYTPDVSLKDQIASTVDNYRLRFSKADV